MIIYRIEIGHKKYGRNWGSQKVAAKGFAQALKKVKLGKQEYVTEVKILATTN